MFINANIVTMTASIFTTHIGSLLTTWLEEEKASVSLVGLLGVDNSETELSMVETEGKEGSNFLTFFLTELDLTFLLYQSVKHF